MRKHKRKSKKEISMPAFVQEMIVFRVVDEVLDHLLLTGTIKVIDGQHVLRDPATGQWIQAAGAIEDFIYVWREINDRMRLGLSFHHLEKLNKALHVLEHEDNALLELALNAQDEVARAKLAFRDNDRNRINEIAKQACTAKLIKMKGENSERHTESV